MRDTTRHFLMPDDAPEDSELPEEVLRLAVDPTDRGREARHRVVSRYMGRVYRMYLKRLKDGAAAKALTQEFITEQLLDPRFYAGLDGSVANSTGYLVRSAINYFINRLKKDPRRRERPLGGRDFASREESVTRKLDRGAGVARVHEAWAKAKEALAGDTTAIRVFEHWCLGRDPSEGQTMDQAAALLRVPLPTFRKALVRARDEFERQYRQLLKTRVFDPPQGKKAPGADAREGNGPIAPPPTRGNRG